MEYCSTCDIAYEGRKSNCPLCEAEGKIEDMVKEIDWYKNKIDRLEKELEKEG